MNKSGGFFGILWFIGWLFTIGFTNLAWWQVILGIVVWPYYLGKEVIALVGG
jgi:hypothetical protein